MGMGAQVQDTPSIIHAKPTEIWQFIQSIGYTEDFKIQDEIVGYDKWHMKYYTAKNPSDNSSVKMTTKLDDDGYEHIWHVVYTWDKRKHMPKGLEKIDFEIVSDEYHSEYNYGKGRYKRHYICSLFGNPMKKHIGSCKVNFFNVIINGTSYSGSY